MDQCRGTVYPGVLGKKIGDRIIFGLCQLSRCFSHGEQFEFVPYRVPVGKVEATSHHVLALPEQQLGLFLREGTWQDPEALVTTSAAAVAGLFPTKCKTPKSKRLMSKATCKQRSSLCLCRYCSDLLIASPGRRFTEGFVLGTDILHVGWPPFPSTVFRPKGLLVFPNSMTPPLLSTDGHHLTVFARSVGGTCGLLLCFFAYKSLNYWFFSHRKWGLLGRPSWSSIAF